MCSNTFIYNCTDLEIKHILFLKTKYVFHFHWSPNIYINHNKCGEKCIGDERLSECIDEYGEEKKQNTFWTATYVSLTLFLSIKFLRQDEQVNFFLFICDFKSVI